MNPTTTRPRLALVPGLSREGVSWRSIAPDRVEIRIEIVNDADRPTEPDDLVIETASLGAFVPFRPVTRIAVGALEPGGRREIRTTVARNRLARQLDLRLIPGAFLQQPGPSPELIDLMRNTEWAGNLNVYFDRRPERAVEVHRALNLRIRAGKPLSFMVDLPVQRTDYRAEVRTSDPLWSARVLPFTPWHYLLIVQPPLAPGVRGGVTVEATRLKDNRRVPVDFTFETVGGEGDTVGCLEV